MSPIPIGILAASAAGGVFYLSYYNHTLDASVSQMSSDAAGNIYTVCSTAAGATFAVPPNRVFKQTPTGEITIQRSIFYETGGSNDGGARGITVSQSGEIFTHARSREGGQLHGLTFKANAAGTLVAARQAFLGTSGSDGVTLAGRMGIGGSRVVIVTDVLASSGYTPGVYAYNQDLTIQWVQRTNNTPSSFDGYPIVDSNGNTYFVGAVSNNQRIYVAKFNSSGVIQWSREKQPGGSLNLLIAGVADSAGHLYAVGQVNQFGVTSSYIARFDAGSGAFVWERNLAISGGSVFRSVCIGADGHLYAVGNTTTGNRAIIASFTLNGTLRWQRIFRRADNATLTGRSIVASADGFAVGFDVRNAANTLTLPMTARLPLDGSLTGTYNIAGISVVYETSSLTLQEPAPASTSGSIGWFTPTFSDSASTRTFPSVTNTNTLLPIG
jgi:hypothetical protein